MLNKQYITGNCTISNGAISKDGTVLFEKNDALPGFLLAAYQHFQPNYPKFYKMDNLSKLGWFAAEILLKGSFAKANYAPEDIAVILANANSSLDDDLKYYDTVKEVASPSLFVYTLPNIVIGEICIRNNFRGEQAFFVQDTFDSSFAKQQVSYLMENDIQQCCLCGWVDVLENDYKAVLFLIEKKKKENAVLLSIEDMDLIFNKA